MTEFIIMFRESMEAALIVGIIYTLLHQQGLNREIKQRGMCDCCQHIG